MYMKQDISCELVPVLRYFAFVRLYIVLALESWLKGSSQHITKKSVHKAKDAPGSALSHRTLMAQMTQKEQK